MKGALSRIRHRVSRSIAKPDFGIVTRPDKATTPDVKNIVITGASGRIASDIRPLLSPNFDAVILTDIIEPESLGANETFVKADIADLHAMQGIMKGVDGLVHLAVKSYKHCFEEVSRVNLQGAYNIFEAATYNDLSRIVFASTLHTHGFYKRDEYMDELSLPRPDSLYAATKLFGEALAYTYAQKHNIGIACIRIGAYGDTPQATEPGNFVNKQDLASIIQLSLTHPDIQFDVFNAISVYAHGPYPKLRAQKYGHKPSYSAETYPEAMKRARRYWASEKMCIEMRGSTFVRKDLEKAAVRDEGG